MHPGKSMIDATEGEPHLIIILLLHMDCMANDVEPDHNHYLLLEPFMKFIRSDISYFAIIEITCCDFYFISYG